MINKILITGGFGLIGFFFAELFVKNNLSIKVFDRYNINKEFSFLENLIYRSEFEKVSLLI